jgi:hypothetical protein
MRADGCIGHAFAGRLGIFRPSVGRTSTVMSTEDLPNPGWSRTSSTWAYCREGLSCSTPWSWRSVGSAVQCPETFGQFRSTYDLQLGESLMQSQHASVGDIGAAHDQRVEAGVSFQVLQTRIADIRVLEHENLEAAHFTQVS